MLEKADSRSKATLAEIAPDKLHQRGRRHRRGFGAENAPAHLNRLETLALSQLNFLCRKATLRPDDDQNRVSFGLPSVQLMQCLLLLLFPEQQFKCLRP